MTSAVLASLKNGRVLNNLELLDLFDALSTSPQQQLDPALSSCLVPYLLTNLNNTSNTQHVDSRRLSLCVACLAFVVERSAETERILGLDSNTMQMIRLCLSRGVYPDNLVGSGGGVPTPLQEAVCCRKALSRLLDIPQIAASSIVRAEIVGFVRKWWQRLAATADASSSSSLSLKAPKFDMPSRAAGAGGTAINPCNPLRAALQIMVCVVESGHEWLLGNLQSLMHDLAPAFLWAYVRCDDESASACASRLLGFLLPCASAATAFHCLRVGQQEGREDDLAAFLHTLDVDSLAACRAGLAGLTFPADAASAHLATELSAALSAAINRGCMVSSPSPTPSLRLLSNSQQGALSPPPSQEQDQSYWAYPDAVSPDASDEPRKRALASLDTTRMSEESEAGVMSLSVRLLSPGAAVEEGEGPAGALGEEAAVAEQGLQGRLDAVQADNTELRRQLLELQREVGRRDGSAQHERHLREEQTALLEEAWAKMSLVAQAEAAAQREAAEAQAWAAACQARLLAQEEDCARLTADTAQAAWQLRAAESRLMEEKGRALAAEGKLHDAAGQAEKQMIAQRDAEGRLRSEAAELRAEGRRAERERGALQSELQSRERALQAETERGTVVSNELGACRDKLQSCELALRSESERGASLVVELGACRDRLQECERTLQSRERALQVEAERVASMVSELSTHRNLISLINSLSADGSASKGKVDGATTGALHQIKALSQSLSQSQCEPDGHDLKENKHNVV